MIRVVFEGFDRHGTAIQHSVLAGDHEAALGALLPTLATQTLAIREAIFWAAVKRLCCGCICWTHKNQRDPRYDFTLTAEDCS